MLSISLFKRYSTLLLTLWTSVVLSQDYPVLNEIVSDNADLFSKTEHQILSAKLIKFEKEAGVNVGVKIKGTGGAKAVGVISGDAKMHVNIKHEKRDNKAEGVFKFDGLVAKIWLTLSVESEKEGGSKKNGADTQPTEPQEEPSAVKKILDSAPPWEINFL